MMSCVERDQLAFEVPTSSPRVPLQTIRQTAFLHLRVPEYSAVPTVPRRPHPPCCLTGKEGPLYR